MNEEQKAKMIAKAENVEAISDFFTQWWSSAELYETAAKVCSTFMFLASKHHISEDDMKNLQALMEQHTMMIEVMKPFERKEANNE